MKDLVLTLTEFQVKSTVMPVEIETCTFDDAGKPMKLFVGQYVQDWLTFHAAHKEDVKLITALQSELDTLKQSVKDAVGKINNLIAIKVPSNDWQDGIGAGYERSIDILRSHGLIGKE